MACTPPPCPNSSDVNCRVVSDGNTTRFTTSVMVDLSSKEIENYAREGEVALNTTGYISTLAGN